MRKRFDENNDSLIVIVEANEFKDQFEWKTLMPLATIDSAIPSDAELTFSKKTSRFNKEMNDRSKVIGQGKFQICR